MRHSLIVYGLSLAVFGGGILAILAHGSAGGLSMPASHPPAASQSYLHFLAAQLQTPLILLLLQIVVIIAFSKTFALLLRFLGQPAVVVEILAGVVLGPSVIGYLWPGFTAFLFPHSSFGSLQMLSQVGLLLYMFVVGMQLDTKAARRRAEAAILVSHTSILCPFFLGVLCALLIYHSYAPPSVGFVPFALFMGIAMSVTAFPVLARILSERGMTTTTMGSLGLTCAAVGDITAWCLLAAVVAIANTGPLSVAYGPVLATLLYTGVMLFAVRPLLARLFNSSWIERQPDKSWMALILVYLLVSALLTDLIGIHALFGAFLAGVAMPKLPELRATVTERIEYTAEIVLLPLFFALTGLRTQITQLTSPGMWLVCLLVVVLAVLGKLVGGMLAARASGIGWRDSLLLGTLLNTRGLMELVILNIGYDLGILSSVMFTIMVLMALITTFMTGPLVSLLARHHARDDDARLPVAAPA